MKEKYKISFEGITKAFPGVLALDDVSFGIKSGCVHVLMGENGAGKSTLMKILNGIYSQTSGEIIIDDRKVDIKNIRDTERLGIAMIHQELNYIPEMTVERFLMLCREPQKFGFINWKKVRQEAEELIEKEGLDYNLKTKMRDLTVSDIQLLEITKVINTSDIKILIMDEPTSALSNAEVDRLFKKIEKLKKRGISIIYISHKMDEIFKIADYITVLRDGKHIYTSEAEEFTAESLVKMMVGREVDNVYPKEAVPIGGPILEVEGLSSYQHKLKNINFHVMAGEIVGLGGLMGAGRTETVRTIFGLDDMDEGVIRIEGKEVNIKNVSTAVKHGLAMVSEDRRRYGLVLCRNIKENISYASLDLISKVSFINKKEETKQVNKHFEQLKIKAPSTSAVVDTLSGGNQQKVVLSKWLMANTKILILDEPTRGIDVGAKHEIYKLIVKLAAKGIGIILISSDLPEFIGMCDRAYIMYNGKITGEMNREEMTQESIMMLATGGKND